MLHPFPDPPPSGDPTPPADPAAIVATPPAVVVPPVAPAVPAPIIPPIGTPAPVVAQPAPAPVAPPEPVVAPEPEPVPGENLSDSDREKIEKQAHYLARKPDEMDYLLKTLEEVTGSSVINSIGSDVAEIKLELAREKAMRKLGLDETDMQFVQGASPDSIMKSAEAFKAMKDGLVATTPADPATPAAPVPNGQPAPVATPATPAPALPQYDSVNTPVTREQAEADLAESLAADGPKILERLGID